MNIPSQPEESFTVSSSETIPQNGKMEKLEDLLKKVYASYKQGVRENQAKASEWKESYENQKQKCEQQDQQFNQLQQSHEELLTENSKLKNTIKTLEERLQTRVSNNECVSCVLLKKHLESLTESYQQRLADKDKVIELLNFKYYEEQMKHGKFKSKHANLEEHSDEKSSTSITDEVESVVRDKKQKISGLSLIKSGRKRTRYTEVVAPASKRVKVSPEKLSIHSSQPADSTTDQASCIPASASTVKLSGNALKKPVLISKLQTETQATPTRSEDRVFVAETCDPDMSYDYKSDSSDIVHEKKVHEAVSKKFHRDGFEINSVRIKTTASSNVKGKQKTVARNKGPINANDKYTDIKSPSKQNVVPETLAMDDDIDDDSDVSDGNETVPTQDTIRDVYISPPSHSSTPMYTRSTRNKGIYHLDPLEGMSSQSQLYSRKGNIQLKTNVHKKHSNIPATKSQGKQLATRKAGRQLSSKSETKSGNSGEFSCLESQNEDHASSPTNSPVFGNQGHVSQNLPKVLDSPCLFEEEENCKEIDTSTKIKQLGIDKKFQSPIVQVDTDPEESPLLLRSVNLKTMNKNDDSPSILKGHVVHTDEQDDSPLLLKQTKKFSTVQRNEMNSCVENWNGNTEENVEQVQEKRGTSQVGLSQKSQGSKSLRAGTRKSARLKQSQSNVSYAESQEEAKSPEAKPSKSKFKVGKKCADQSMRQSTLTQSFLGNRRATVHDEIDQQEERDLLKAIENSLKDKQRGKTPDLDIIECRLKPARSPNNDRRIEHDENVKPQFKKPATPDPQTPPKQKHSVSGSARRSPRLSKHRISVDGDETWLPDLTPEPAKQIPRKSSLKSRFSSEFDLNGSIDPAARLTQYEDETMNENHHGISDITMETTTYPVKSDMDTPGVSHGRSGQIASRNSMGKEVDSSYDLDTSENILQAYSVPKNNPQSLDEDSQDISSTYRSVTFGKAPSLEDDAVDDYAGIQENDDNDWGQPEDVTFRTAMRLVHTQSMGDGDDTADDGREDPVSKKAIADNDSFDKVPKPQSPGYKYAEVVRKKNERRKLNAVECQQCEDYYRGLGLSSSQIAERVKDCSRHRTKYEIPGTPETFWEIGFPTTQACEDKGYLKEDTQPGPSRYRRQRPYKQKFESKKQ